MLDRCARLSGLALALMLVAGGFTPQVTLAQPAAEALSSRFRQASRQILPAVVTVRPQGGGLPLNGMLSPGDQAIRPLHEGGSGVVIDSPRGLVVTNDHVVASATRGLVVILANGRERPVSQIWRDPKSDLALLAIDPQDLVAAPWGDSNQLDIGDWVLAIGGPFGLSGTVTAGIVSGKGRGIGMALYEDLIQTDAAINPGNSGGPLINLQGEVVGINTALKSNGGSYEGVGFAVPASRARRVVAELAEFGRVRRAYLGITIRPLDSATASRLNLPDGAVIATVFSGSPAAAAGLQPGDVILSVGGQPAGGAGTLQSLIEVARVGEPLDLTINRRGQILAVQIRPEPQPEQFGLPAPTTVTPTTAVAPAEVLVPVRPRGLHINVPGANLFVPGPNLDITPFGVRRPRPVFLPSAPAAGVVVSGPTVVPSPAFAAPSIPGTEPEPELHPVDTIPAPVTSALPVPTEMTSRSANFASLGLSLAETSPALANQWQFDPGVSGLVITGVAANTPADRGGLEPGMILTDAGGKMVGSLSDLRRVLADRPPGRDLLVRIKKGAKAEFRVVVAPDAPAGTEAVEPTLDPLPPPTPRPL